MSILYPPDASKPRRGWKQPTKRDYISAFQQLPPYGAALLKIQVAFPGHGATIRQLGRLANYKGYRATNGTYGNAGKRVSLALSVKPPFYRSSKAPNWWSIISYGSGRIPGYIWVMRPEAVEACEEMGWKTGDSVFLDPTETGTDKEYLEGKRMPVSVSVHERSEEARRACLSFYGSWRCQICQFDFEAVYGELGKEFIHVHHLSPLAERDGAEYQVDPKNDLLPVCPNCHSMLHRRQPPLAPGDLRRIMGR